MSLKQFLLYRDVEFPYFGVGMYRPRARRSRLYGAQVLLQPRTWKPHTSNDEMRKKHRA